MPSGGPRPIRTNTEAKPVSGPGKLSERTDMIPQGGNYGDRKAYVEQTQGAPIAQGTPPPQPVSMPRSAPKVTSVFEPTSNPNQPVTDGAPIGPGYSPTPPPQTKYTMVSKYMDRLETMANQPDAPEAFKGFLTYVKAELNKG